MTQRTRELIVHRCQPPYPQIAHAEQTSTQPHAGHHEEGNRGVGKGGICQVVHGYQCAFALPTSSWFTEKHRCGWSPRRHSKGSVSDHGTIRHGRLNAHSGTLIEIRDKIEQRTRGQIPNVRNVERADITGTDCTALPCLYVRAGRVAHRRILLQSAVEIARYGSNQSVVDSVSIVGSPGSEYSLYTFVWTCREVARRRRRGDGSDAACFSEGQ